MSKAKRMPGYLALVLSDETSQLLRTYAAENCAGLVKAEHVTMAYRPTRPVYEQYAGLLGRELDFKITKVVSDGSASAVCVEGVPSENLYPHVTLALGTLPNGEPTPSRYVKELLFTNPSRTEGELSPPIVGRGRVEFVRF